MEIEESDPLMTKRSAALILGKFITLLKLHVTYIRKEHRNHKYKAYPAPATEYVLSSCKHVFICPSA